MVHPLLAEGHGDGFGVDLVGQRSRNLLELIVRSESIGVLVLWLVRGADVLADLVCDRVTVGILCRQPLEAGLPIGLGAHLGLFQDEFVTAVNPN